MNGALLLILVLLFLLLVVGLGWLQVRLERGARERTELARRITRLEGALAGDRAGDAPAASAVSRAPSVAAAAPPVLHAPPDEQDYAAAEAELSALETNEWGPDEGADTDGRALADSRAAFAVGREPDAPRVAPPLRPAGSPSDDGASVRDRRPAAFSVEDFLGGRVLLVVGVIVVLFALGFFLKYAIEQDLVEPRARVAIGVAAGVAALVAGDIVRRRGFELFGHAVMGGGLGALFLSTFFAAARYDLIERPTAFGVTACIALAGIVVAMRREAPLLAYLGFLGGYISPAILGESRDALEGLTGWLLALHVGVFVVVWLRRWPGLDLMALGSSSVYYLIWADSHFAAPRVGAAAWCLVALTAMGLAIALVPGVARRRALGPTALLTAIVAGATSVTAGFELFQRDHRFALGAAILVLGVVFVLAARRAVGRLRDVAVDEPVLDGCAVAAVAAAIPTVLDGAALAPAWAAAGVVAPRWWSPAASS